MVVVEKRPRPVERSELSDLFKPDWTKKGERKETFTIALHYPDNPRKHAYHIQCRELAEGHVPTSASIAKELGMQRVEVVVYETPLGHLAVPELETDNIVVPPIHVRMTDQLDHVNSAARLFFASPTLSERVRYRIGSRNRIGSALDATTIDRIAAGRLAKNPLKNLIEHLHLPVYDVEDEELVLDYLSPSSPNPGIVETKSTRKGAGARSQFTYAARATVGTRTRDGITPSSAVYVDVNSRTGLGSRETFTVDFKEGETRFEVASHDRNALLRVTYDMDGVAQKRELMEALPSTLSLDAPADRINIPATLLAMRDAISEEPSVSVYDLIVPVD